MSQETNIIDNDVDSLPLNKGDTKSSLRKNVIPITSISDLGSVVNELQSQLNLLIGNLSNNTTPEFKALMEGYVNKANEVEELKIKIENTLSRHEELKSETSKVRETNRNLIHELQCTRDTLKNLEYNLNTFQASSNKREEEYKEAIQNLDQQIEEYEKNKKELELKIKEIIDSQGRVKQEAQDQNFKFKQTEMELITERDNLRKQLKEFELLLNEQHEQLEFKTKEVEYKEALLNQFIKQNALDKLPVKNTEPITNKDNQNNKRKKWPFS